MSSVEAEPVCRKIQCVAGLYMSLPFMGIAKTAMPMNASFLSTSMKHVCLLCYPGRVLDRVLEHSMK